MYDRNPLVTKVNALSASSIGKSRFITILLGVLIHIPLAISMRQFSLVATIHAFATVAVGSSLIMLKRPMERAAYVGAYIAGAEVLWRMTHAAAFWEYGKYATAFIFIMALIRVGHVKLALLPVIYFAALLPSILLTAGDLDLDEARKQLSFNLSGPFVLMVSVIFFSNLKLSTQQVHRLIVAVISPVAGISALIFLRVFTTSTILFSERSSSVAVTGFGPNQVSSALSLGALLAFLHLMYVRSDLRLKVLMFGMIIIFTAQSALTFSRSGVYMLVGSVIVSAFFLVNDTRSRIKLVLVVGLLLGAAYYVVLPRLNAYTNQTLTNRFENTYTSGREEVLVSELKLWRENFLLGVGPGVSMSLSEFNGEIIAPHTEFTRLLVEHGIFGLVSLGLLLSMALANIGYKKTPKEKAFAVAILVWSFAYMSVNAMRLVAPSLLFGLASLSLLKEGELRPQLIRNLSALRSRYSTALNSSGMLNKDWRYDRSEQR